MTREELEIEVGKHMDGAWCLEAPGNRGVQAVIALVVEACQEAIRHAADKQRKAGSAAALIAAAALEGAVDGLSAFLPTPTKESDRG